MNTLLTRLIPFLCALTLITYFSWGIEPALPNEVPGETLARMMKLGEELATPNDNHAFIQKLTGEWSTQTSIMKLPPEAGTATYSMVFGGRFLDGLHEGTISGIAFEGRVTLGYDNYKHKFVINYADNLSTSMRHAEGMLNKKGTSLSLWGTMDEWMTDEHDKPVMYRYRIIDEDHYVFEVHDLGIVSGGDTLVIEVQYERLHIQ